MSNATRVTIGPVAPNPDAIREIQDGLREALYAMDSRQWDFAFDQRTGQELEPEPVSAFEPIVSEVIAEVAADVADLLAAAMNRRLPWTWEPER
jgi:hypothetical protein